MLAAWSLFGATDVRMMNASRTLLGGSMNAAAVVLFIGAGTIWWSETLAMLASSIAGGYVGARLVLSLPRAVARPIVIAVSVGVTIAFFLR
jgi:hypothetical protein